MPPSRSLSLVAAVSLVAGYAVAAGTGRRWLGGLVLLAALAWCWRGWAARRGIRTAAALAGAYVLLFVASHLLALAVGAWTSVLVVALAMGLLSLRFG